MKLFKAQAEAGDVVLLFADESEALTHPHLARAWAKRGADLRVPALAESQKIAMMGSLDYARRRLIVTTSRTKRARTSSRICMRSIPSTARNPARRPSPSSSSPTTVRSTSARPAGRRWPSAPTGSPSSGCPIRPGVERQRNRLGRSESEAPCASTLHQSRDARHRHSRPRPR